MGRNRKCEIIWKKGKENVKQLSRSNLIPRLHSNLRDSILNPRSLLSPSRYRLSPDQFQRDRSGQNSGHRRASSARPAPATVNFSLSVTPALGEYLKSASDFR